MSNVVNPKPEVRVCIGCGRDTTSKSAICQRCYRHGASNKDKSDDGWQPQDGDRKPDYDNFQESKA